MNSRLTKCALPLYSRLRSGEVCMVIDKFKPFLGSRRDIARALSVTYQAVRKYDDAIPVRPVNRVLQLCELSGWRVKPHEVAPDVYPHPDDGVPREARTP